MTKLYTLVGVISLLLCLTVSQTVLPICPAGGYDSKTCTCGTGMVQLNGRCVCNYGYIPVNGMCQKCSSTNFYNDVSCSGGAAGCQTGYVLVNSVCRLNWSADNCGDQLYWNGAFCSNTTPTACSLGFKWNGATCISQFAGSCNSSNYFNGVSCVPFQNPPVCAYSNYIYYSLTNVCLNPTNTTTCASGSYWNGNYCQLNNLNGTITCQPGFYFNGKRCAIATQRVYCLTGSVWLGNGCSVSNVTSNGTQAFAQGGRIATTTGQSLSATGGSSLAYGTPTQPASSNSFKTTTAQPTYNAAINNNGALSSPDLSGNTGGTPGVGIAYVPPTTTQGGVLAVSRGNTTPGSVGIVNSNSLAFGQGGLSSGNGAVGGTGTGTSGRSGVGISSADYSKTLDQINNALANTLTSINNG